MTARVLSSATGALFITAALLLVMQLLIAAGKEIIGEPRIRHDLRLVKVRDESELVRKDIPPARPIKPLLPPRTIVSDAAPESASGVHLPAPTPPDSGSTITGIHYGDGPLFNIFKVSPNYPSAALARGLEGTVLVQYDVTTEGQVVNVTVLESSHTVFNKSAIAAALRFKYKPRTVDGMAYASQGLKNLFRFELED